MKQVKTIFIAVLALLVLVWVLDKIPFSQEVDQEVTAQVYRDGEVVAETAVLMKGEKTRYLFRENSFVGEFRIPYVKETDVEDLQTQIQWGKQSLVQFVKHFRYGTFSGSQERGIIYCFGMSEDMTEFAVRLTGEEVIATSEEVYARYCELFA